jgi:hypothetical protein
MPKLDLQTLPTVLPQQGPTPQFNLNPRGAFGEELSGAAAGAALLLGKHALEAKRNADVAVVEDAETELQKRVTGRLYGTKDAPGFLFQQGHGALEQSASTLEQLQKDQQQIADGLTDEGQRAAFRRRTDGTLVQAQRHVETHVGQQRQIVEGQAFEGRRAAALDAIANGYDQPGVIDRERQNMEPLFMQEARRRGLEGADTYPPKEGTPAAVFLGLWRKDVAKTVVERLLAAKEGEAAQGYLSKPMVPGGPTAGEVLGTEADKYVERIGHVQAQVDAFDRAQQAVDASRDPKTGKVNEQNARALIRGAPKAYRREAVSNLEGLLQSEREGWNATIKDHWDSAKTAYLGGPDQRGRKGLAAIDGKTSSWLINNAPDTWKHLLDWSDADAREAQGLPATAAQERAFSTIATRLVDAPNEFVGLDGAAFEERYLSQVAPRDRRALLGHFLQTKGQAVRPDESLPTSVMAEIVEVGRGAGAFPNKGAPATWEPKRAAAHAQVVRDLLEFQAAEKKAGRTIDPKRWTEEVNKRFRKGTVTGGGSWFGDRSDVPAAIARTDPDLADKPFVEEIPDAFRKEAVKELQADPAASFPVTEDNVRYLWEKTQGLNPLRPETMKPYDRKQAELESLSRFRVGTLAP